jgi:hypothetical protein
MYLFMIALAAGAALVTRKWGIAFGPSNQTREPHAVLGPRLTQRVRELSRRHLKPREIEQAALELTARTLHFGLGHRTSSRFDEEREGHCVEYAELFAALFNGIADGSNASSHARVVRSAPASIWSVQLPGRSFRDHDYDLVSTPGEADRFIDPTFYDVLLGRSLSSNVRGTVR